jgi:hypothetical protein
MTSGASASVNAAAEASQALAPSRTPAQALARWVHVILPRRTLLAA